MIKKSIFEQADFEEIDNWLSYGIEEYHKDVHEKDCDADLLKYWNENISYRGIVGCSSGCHLTGLIIDILVDKQADQAQLLWVDGNGTSPMGDIISPVSDKAIFDEFEKEFEKWPAEIFINTDEVNDHNVLTKTRFKKFLKKHVVPWWPDYMPPFDNWFEKLYEIDNFNKFTDWINNFIESKM